MFRRTDCHFSLDPAVMEARSRSRDMPPTLFFSTDCHFSLDPAVMEARPSHPASETAIQPQRLRSSRSTRRWRQELICSSTAGDSAPRVGSRANRAQRVCVRVGPSSMLGGV